MDDRSVSGDARAGICWHSNFAGAGTGYGVQTAQVARQIKATGRPITLSNNYGTQGFITEWEGIEVLPTGFHPYSADILDAHRKYSQEQTGRPTALITLFDAWVFKGAKLDDIKVIASWVPIDHMPAPPDVLEWCRRDNVLPIAMANFGARMLDAAGIDHRYIPHGVDTKVFTPGATVDGASGRSLLKVPDDAFLVGMIAANKGTAPMRKAWGENLLALGQFMAKHDDVYVYMHTEKRGAQGGVDLIQLAGACGIPEERLVWTDQWAYYAGLPPFVLAGLMAGMDVNLAASRGEGFGIPVIEAAACGVPSIVSNFTAQPELVEGHGYIASVQPYWDPLQTSWFATPLVHSVLEQLESAYDTARDPQRKAAARAHAETYDNELVFKNYWLPVLAEIDERMAETEDESIQRNRRTALRNSQTDGNTIPWDRLGKRQEAFKYFHEHLPQGCNIVETGSIRELGNWEGDGQSTIVWNAIAADRDGKVITIDIDPIGAELVHELELTHTNAITADSLLILQTLTEPVDLLYLDSFDVDFDRPQPAADHHLKELNASLHLLRSGSIVAVDDNKETGGKGSEVAAYFAANNVPEIITGYVRAWRI